MCWFAEHQTICKALRKPNDGIEGQCHDQPSYQPSKECGPKDGIEDTDIHRYSPSILIAFVIPFIIKQIQVRLDVKLF